MKPFKLTKNQGLRKSLTAVAINVEERLAASKPVRAMELAFHRAMDRKLAHEPRFAWGAK